MVYEKCGMDEKSDDNQLKIHNFLCLLRESQSDFEE
jgi:hypothetical protein